MAPPCSATEQGGSPLVVRDEVALVRRYVEAWNRRDLAAIEAALDPEVEWERAAEVADCSAAFPDRLRIAGRPSLLDFAGTLFEVFAETTIEIESCVEGEKGEVVVAGTTRFRGRRSGAETLSSWVRAYTVGERGLARIEPWA